LPTSTLSENKVHQFNLSTLRFDKELETLEINLLLLPSEIRKHAIVAAQWHTAMDKQVCPLCNSMQGGIIPVDSPEWGRVFPPIHLGCRCNLSYITGDERGVVARLAKYKPMDPVLLKHWSSKMYTDAEIKAMAKKRPDLLPEKERAGFNLPDTVKDKKEFKAIVRGLDDKGVEKAFIDIKPVYRITNIKERMRDIEKNWEKYYITRRRWKEWKRLHLSRLWDSEAQMKKVLKIEAMREKLAQKMLTKKYKNWNAVFKDWDELVKITGSGSRNERWIWTEYFDYRHAIQVDWAATEVSIAEAIPRMHSMDSALNKWLRMGGHDPQGVTLQFMKGPFAQYTPSSNIIELGSGHYYWSEETCVHEYAHALEHKLLLREWRIFNKWHAENVKITFTTAHMRNQTYYIQRNEFTEEWAIGIDNLLTKVHDSPQHNFAHPKVKAKLKELLSDVFKW